MKNRRRLENSFSSRIEEGRCQLVRVNLTALIPVPGAPFSGGQRPYSRHLAPLDLLGDLSSLGRQKRRDFTEESDHVPIPGADTRSATATITSMIAYSTEVTPRSLDLNHIQHSLRLSMSISPILSRFDENLKDSLAKYLAYLNLCRCRSIILMRG